MNLYFFSTELFWGGLLILLGLSMIIKTIFGIDIPVIKVLLALFLIYLGLSIITDIGNKKRHAIAFDKKIVFPEHDNYYKIRFGQGIIDLSHLKKNKDSSHITINVMFGDALIKIPKNISAQINVDINFGNATLPDGTKISSGMYSYKTEEDVERYSTIIDANVTFGNIRIKIY